MVSDAPPPAATAAAPIRVLPVAVVEHRASEGVRQWRDKAKLSSDLRLPDARGIAATRLLNAGLTLAEISNHMGWSIRYAANVIEIYARVSVEETDSVLLKLAAAKGAET